MTETMSPAPRASLLQRGLLLEYLTVGWNIAEGVIAIGAGLVAGSVALIGFGVDSFVETVSGAILAGRLRSELRGDDDAERIERVERLAERLVGISFLILGTYVAYEAITTLAAGDRPGASPVGIALTITSLVVMLWLARAKRRTGEALASRALIADSKQTYACWYLSATTLAGLAMNAIFGLWWADPSAAMIIVVFLGREGVEALRGGEHDD